MTIGIFAKESEKSSVASADFAENCRRRMLPGEAKRVLTSSKFLKESKYVLVSSKILKENMYAGARRSALFNISPPPHLSI